MAFPVELGLILLFSIVGGVLAVRLKQPSVLGLILVGAIVGPHSLALIKDTELISTSIEIGAILLLFTLGIEFSLKKIFNIGLRAFIVAAIKLGVVFFISYYVAMIMGFGQLTAAFIGVILSITSTVIVIKILEQSGSAKREEMPLLVTILIIEDIFAVFALTFFSSLEASTQLRPSGLFADLVLSLALMAGAYLIMHKILKPIVRWLSKYSAEETNTFLSLGICGLMSYIALVLDLSPSVGAFLAGNIVASFPNSEYFEKAIHPFLLTFTSLFFFSIGTNVNFSTIYASLAIVAILFVVNVAAKFLAVGFGTYMMTSFNGRQAVFSGITMISVGEFSLLIAKESENLNLGIDLVSITAAVIFLSSLCMSLLVTRHEKVYQLVSGSIPKRVSEDMTLFSKYVNSISWSAIKDRFTYRNIGKDWRILVRNLISLFFGFVIFYFFWDEGMYYLSRIISNQSVLSIVVIIFMISFFFPAFKIFTNSRKILSNSMKIATKVFPKEINEDRRMVRHLLFIMLLFFATLFMPLASVFFDIGILRYVLTTVLIIAMVFYMTRSFTMLERLSKSKDSKLEKFERQYSKSREKLQKKNIG
jgi:Kef-type K+ transport system membrane component KefB